MANNLSNLQNYINSVTREQTRQLMIREGKKLERIAKSVWRSYQNSYTPKVYAEHINGVAGRRTGKTMESIKLGRPKLLDGGLNMGIELTWRNDLVYHDSIFGSDYQQGHAVMLISSGWKVDSGWHKGIYRLGYYEGFDYLGKVEKTYKAMKHPDVFFEIQWSGRYLR